MYVVETRRRARKNNVLNSGHFFGVNASFSQGPFVGFFPKFLPR
jgi:hypothetical protein